MWFPEPIYRALPYLYFIIGIIVGINMDPSMFSMMSVAALFIGGALVLLMRHAAKKEESRRCAEQKNRRRN